MAAVDAKPRKRDRLKARAKRYMTVPLAVRTADLPRRAASAAAMLTVAGGAVALGGAVLDSFIALVALVCFLEFVQLILRAAANWAIRLPAIVAGGAYIGLAAAALAGLEPSHLIAVLGVVIFTDTCAYFAGRSIGGPKIAPSISPSKTWAGLAGGMIGSSLWLVMFAVFMSLATTSPTPEEVGVDPRQLAIAAAVGAGLAVAAQVGDFFESWLKRRAGKKDSGTLIPGHGGVFDRVDGLLPVALIVGFLAASA